MKKVPISRIRRFMALPPEALVRLYSYQGEAAWRHAEETGYWTGNPTNVEGEDHGWTDPYRWIRDRMAERIPNFSGDYPMWAWLKRPSTKPKPRKYRGTSDNIRITALVPKSRILLSNYDDWHSVLNTNLLCETEAEWDEHCARFPHHHSEYDADQLARYMAEIEASWHAVLDFKPATDPMILNWLGHKKYFRVQACVDRIHWSEVVSVRRFPMPNALQDQEAVFPVR